MLKVTEFELEHLTLVDDFEEMKEAYRLNPKAFESYLDGPAYTVYCDDGIVLMGGIIIQYAGVAMAWSWPTKLCKKYPVYSIKIGKWVVFEGIKSFDLHKVFAYTDADDKSARKWVETIGFKEEALLRQHGSNREDVILYSIIVEKENG
jgi:hypothetical protein